MSDPQTDSPWYRDGLSFECTRCGACCTGAPGYVWVNEDEIHRLAELRGETVEHFAKVFLRQVGGDLSLVEKPGGDCIFWSKDEGCTVYEGRPVQCRTWPFWSENIETPEAWEDVKKGCPGSGSGRVFSLDEIRESAARIPS